MGFFLGARMDDGPIFKELLYREEQLMSNVVRTDAGKVSELIEDKCIEVSESGQRTVYRVGDALLASEGVVFITNDSATLSDLSLDCKLLSYISARIVVDKQSRTFHSSIWKMRDNVWKRVYHQGTVCVR